MKSAYQLDREMMAAWQKWMKAQEEADRAKAEYDRATLAMKKHMEEHKAKEATAR
jgi:hypothetical protein